MSLNGAHWQLPVNQFTIICSLMATFVLVYGRFRQHQAISQLSFGLFTLRSITAVIRRQNEQSSRQAAQ